VTLLPVRRTLVLNQAEPKALVHPILVGVELPPPAAGMTMPTRAATGCPRVIWTLSRRISSRQSGNRYFARGATSLIGGYASRCLNYWVR